MCECVATCAARILSGEVRKNGGRIEQRCVKRAAKSTCRFACVLRRRIVAMRESLEEVKEAVVGNGALDGKGPCAGL